MANTNPVTDEAAIIDYVIEKAQSADTARCIRQAACTKGLEGSFAR